MKSRKQLKKKKEWFKTFNQNKTISRTKKLKVKLSNHNWNRTLKKQNQRLFSPNRGYRF